MSETEKKVGYFRGEGGGVFGFDLPLGIEDSKRLVRGQLVRVQENGDPWVGPENDTDVLPPGRKFEVSSDGLFITVTDTDGAADDTKADVSEPDKSSEDVSAGKTTENDVPMPKASGSKATWQDYAKSQGHTDADIEGMTRDDLARTFGAKQEIPTHVVDASGAGVEGTGIPVVGDQGGVE